MTEALAAWLDETLGWRGALQLTRFGGGNSNETYHLACGGHACVLRRPPQHPLAPSAHSVGREHRLLTALADTRVKAPRPVALCEDASVLGAPFLLMECIANTVSLTDTLPPDYGDDTRTTMAVIGEEMVDNLAALHGVDWRAAGLDDFGRPQEFLARQVSRWRRQYAGYRCRDLPRFEEVAAWLETHQPPDQPPAVLHGDLHLDNCLFDSREPVLRAIVDWEMATVGDPLLDVGLLLALWGARPVHPYAVPAVQGVSRLAGAPTRDDLAQRYAAASDRSVDDLAYYMALALWKLAAIIEGAYAQHLAGQLHSAYAQQLETDVPLLLEEAAHHAGIAS